MFFCKYKKLEINLKTYINKIKNAIIKPNKPTASVKANPKIVYWNKTLRFKKLRAVPITNEPNTIPTPAPAPIKLQVAKPAPNNLQHSIRTSVIFKVCI